MGKNGLPDPPRKPQRGESFDSLSPLDSPLSTTKGGALRGPSPWIPPQALLFQKTSQRPALCGGALAPARSALRSKPTGLILFLRTAPGGFPKGRAEALPFGRFKGVSRGGKSKSPLWGFLGGVGGYSWPPRIVPHIAPTPRVELYLIKHYLLSSSVWGFSSQCSQLWSGRRPLRRGKTQ